MKFRRTFALLIFLLTLNLLIAGLYATPTKAEGTAERPIIVCTTNVVGSIAEEFVGDEAEIVVLVRPGLCPADYDMKPSDVYAISNAKLLFYQALRGEFWLQGLIEAAGNENLTMIEVPGVYNTPEGAKRCINIVGGNLSEALSMDLDAKIESMLAEVDAVASEIASEAQTLEVEKVNVICMNWQTAFVEWVGFNVVADYGPPETLSAADITILVETARREEAALIIDNLQISVEFGAGIASEVGDAHVVLTNFPGAVPGTGNLTEMFSYNAKQLFDGLRTWRSTKSLRAEMENLKNQLTIFQAATSVALIVAVVEAVWLYIGKKSMKSLETREVMPNEKPR